LKKVSNLLLLITCFIAGYLLIANINHIIYLKQYGTFDFNTVNLEEDLKKLKNNIEKINTLEPNVFSQNEIKAIRSILQNIPERIKQSVLFDFEGEVKFYLKDIHEIDRTTTTFALDNITLVEFLIEHNPIFKEYRDMLIISFFTESYIGNESFVEPIYSYRYRDIDFFSTNMETRVTSRVYTLRNTISKLNFTLTLILDMEGLNE